MAWLYDRITVYIYSGYKINALTLNRNLKKNYAIKNKINK